MPHFIIVIIPYSNLIHLSWIIKCLFLRNTEPLKLNPVLRSVNRNVRDCSQNKSKRSVAIVFGGGSEHPAVFCTRKTAAYANIQSLCMFVHKKIWEYLQRFYDLLFLYNINNY